MPITKIFSKFTGDQSGTALYFVISLLTILLTSASVATSVAAIENAKTRGQELSDILVLEAAKLCQASKNQECEKATNIDEYLKADLEFKALLVANGVSPSEILVSNLGVILEENGKPVLNRSQVTVTITRNLNVPLAGIIGRSNQSTVVSKAKASWTDYAYITSFAKGQFLPLFINDCVFPELKNPSTVGYAYEDNGACSPNNNEPELWWFGNAGQSQTTGSGACYVNNAGPTLNVGDAVNNPSYQAMPANSTCDPKEYVVPYFKTYIPAGPVTRTVTTTTYEKVWTVFSRAVITQGNTSSVVPNSGVTQTYTKICQNSSDGFTSPNCTNKSGSPTPSSGATCVGVSLTKNQNCDVITDTEVLISTTPKTTTATYYAYSKTWTVFSQAVATDKKGVTRKIDSGVTQTYVKTCDNSTDAFDAPNCVTDAGYPTPGAGATCVGVTLSGSETCAVVTDSPILISTTQKTTTPYAKVAGFMKVKLLSIQFNSTTATNAQPTHKYTLAYAGQDIRLIPN